VLDPHNMMVNEIDFGPFVTYDYGVATNPTTQKYIQHHGGYVGVQLQHDVRWPYNMPFFWFSVTGFCPNIRYDQVPMTRDTYEKVLSERREQCSKFANENACHGSGTCQFVGGACSARDPAPQCLNHSPDSPYAGSKVLGGLCPGGAGNATVVPTGDPSCTYSYAPAERVLLDEVVGIPKEDCGGRACTNWLDFRHNCSNPEYKWTFNPQTHSLEPFKYCVEYDVHPACEADCGSPACRALSDADKDIGLPFWRGICNARLNEGRTETMDDRIGRTQADVDQSLEVRPATTPESCLRQSPGPCAPAPGQGGNYCTRRWGGVCVNCYIPGTQISWAATSMSYCPYSVLESADYRSRFPQPSCATSRPQDLCCLYTGTCSLKAAAIQDVPLDEDGFAIVASWQNSSVMAQFLGLAAEKAGYDTKRGNMSTFAYTQWDIAPMKGVNLSLAIQQMLQDGLAFEKETPTTTPDQTADTTKDMMDPGKHQNRLVHFLFPAAGGLLIFATAICVFLRFGLLRSPQCSGQTADKKKHALDASTRFPPASLGDEEVGHGFTVAGASLPRLGLNGRTQAPPMHCVREGGFQKPSGRSPSCRTSVMQQSHGDFVGDLEQPPIEANTPTCTKDDCHVAVPNTRVPSEAASQVTGTDEGPDDSTYTPGSGSRTKRKGSSAVELEDESRHPDGSEPSLDMRACSEGSAGSSSSDLESASADTSSKYEMAGHREI